MATRRKYYLGSRDYRNRQHRRFLAIALAAAALAVLGRFLFETNRRQAADELIDGQASSLVAPGHRAEAVNQVDMLLENAVNSRSQPQVILSAPPVAQETPPDVAPVASPPVKREISLGEKLFHLGQVALEKKNYIEVRELLSEAIDTGLNGSQERQARQMLNRAADQWLFSRNIFGDDVLCQHHNVAKGERLVHIGNRYGVPYQLLMDINGIEKPELLPADASIKVIKGPFRVVVDRSDFQMSVFLGGILVRSYPVGLGASERQTPTGLWRVRPGKKQVDPAWTDKETGKHYYGGATDNPLGKRWIGLEGLEGEALGREGFGIHGTIKPEEIGKMSSRGCIRLRNEHVIEVFNMLQEGKTEVQVVE